MEGRTGTRASGGPPGRGDGNGNPYRALFRGAPDPVFVLEHGTLRILEANEAASRTYALSGEELREKRFRDLEVASTPDALEGLLDTGARERQGESFGSAGRWRHRTGEGREILVEVAYAATTWKGARAWTVAVRDVTELAEAVDRLRESEERFRLLVENVRDYAIYHLDPGGRVASWNAGAERVKGYRAGEVLGEPFSRFYPPEEAARGEPEANLAAAEAEGTFRGEGWRVRADGSRFWAEATLTALRDEEGGLRGFAKITRDITERRERELALRALAARVRSVREEEQKRLSRVAHDELGQDLTALRLQVTWILQRVQGGDPGIVQRAREALAQVDRMIRAVRGIAEEMRPVLLDHLGLPAAVEWKGERFREQSGIEVRLDLRVGDGDVGPEDAEAAFRVLQEALANVARHAEASRVDVLLTKAEEGLVLEVVDDGRGFAGDTAGGPEALGILGMRETALARGGVLEIEGRPGKGTRVRLRLPGPPRGAPR